MLINAIDGFSDDVGRLHAALDASCVVGIWEWDHLRSAVVYDAGAAKLLVGDPDLGETVISGPMALARVHPADQDWLIAHMCQAVRLGGLVLAEYRVITQDGGIRWLLSRGRTYLDGAGLPSHTRGILIDTTEMRDDEEHYVFGPNASCADPMERAADLAIALKHTLGPDAPAQMRLLTDLLLMQFGRTLAGVDAGG